MIETMEPRPPTLGSRRVTAEEYLRLADASPTKLEFKAGEVIDMAGATWQHVQIRTNLLAELHRRLKGTPCQAAGPDSRTKAASDRYSYADISIVCGEPEFDPLDPRTITNPTLLFEVLSPTTGATDRGEKFFHYIQIPSLKAYFLVATDKARIECFVRGASGTFEVGPVEEGDGSTLRIAALGIELPLRDIYDRVGFGTPAA
jgi:Uma2 family endonuclease